MRRSLWLLAAVAAVSTWAVEGHAQQIGFSDPFFLYYGFYLPRQAALAAQPRVEDTIDAQVASRQSYASTNSTRGSLYDPNGTYGKFDPNSTYNPLDPNSGANKPASAGVTVRMRSGVTTSNPKGDGPALYFNRTVQHYPTMRAGRGPNKNIAVPGRGVRGGGGGGYGMPTAAGAMGMGSQGPR